MYRSIQTYQDLSGVHWDSPENEEEIGRGANITSEADGMVWQRMIDSKVRQNMWFPKKKSLIHYLFHFRETTL